MEDTRNLLFALVLSLLVILVWQTFFTTPTPSTPAASSSLESAYPELSGTMPALDGLTDESLTINSDAPTLLSRNDALAHSPTQRLTIQSPQINGSIATTGLRIDDITLTQYKQTLDPESENVALFSPENTEQAYFGEFGWIGNNITVPSKNTQWNIVSGDSILSPTQPVTLRWDNNEGLIFTRIVTLDEEFMFTITDSIENTSDAAVTLFPYGLLNRIRPDAQSIYISHEGALAVIDNTLQEITYDDLQEEPSSFDKVKDSWVGLADKYWLSAIIPGNASHGEQLYKIDMRHYVQHDRHHYHVGFAGKGHRIAPNDTSSITHNMFVGAKKVHLLDSYSEDYDIPLFDRAVDFGWLYFLTRPFFTLLHFFHGYIGNFGVAILLMTIVIRLCLFPIANKSYHAMARMREVMPEMQKLRERYKDDRAALGQETMKFYREKKINPASGCLPILIQIPIFFALYKVLFVTIEMRHAPFYGWIKDLSAPDPTNFLNLFGLLPFGVPDYMPIIGVLPILFSLSMFIQQKLNPPPTDPTQKLIMQWLPVIFLFVFAGFPAGLVLYWVWNNALSIIQQFIITRSVHKAMQKKG